METLKGLNIYHWTAGQGIAEEDFVAGNGTDVIPVEVKVKNLSPGQEFEGVSGKVPTEVVRSDLHGGL